MSDTVVLFLTSWVFLGQIALWLDLGNLKEDLEELSVDFPYLVILTIWLFYLVSGAFAFYHIVSYKLKKHKKG